MGWCKLRGTQHFQLLEDYGDFNSNGNKITVLCEWKMAQDWEGNEGGRKRREGSKAELGQSSESSLKQNQCVCLLGSLTQ